MSGTYDSWGWDLDVVYDRSQDEKDLLGRKNGISRSLV